MNRWIKILIAMGCGLAMTAVAQVDTNAPRTKLDAFEGSIGVVIVRGSADMGVVTTAAGTISVKCKESADANTGRKEHGLAVTITGADRQSDTTILDYDELDALLGGLDYLAKANWSVTSLPSFDAVFTTRDGLQASAYSSKNRPGMLGASLKSSRTAKVRISLSAQEFALFRSLVQQGKAKLDTLRTG